MHAIHNAHVLARASHQHRMLADYLRSVRRPDAAAYQPARTMARYWGQVASLEVLRPICATHNVPLLDQPVRPV